jgi:uncharacterized protein YlxW (UPF0749 family)
MKLTVRSLSIWVTTFLLLVSSDIVQGQRLHDEARDKEAAKAAQLADEITSKSSFEKQLKNLDTLSKNALEVYFAGAKRQMELDIRSLRTWGDVGDLSERVQITLSAEDFVSSREAQENLDDLERDCNERRTELGKSICTAKAELARLKQAVQRSEAEGKRLDQELKTRLEKIDTIDGLVDKTASFLGSGPGVTINELADVFLDLSRSYVNYVNKLATINNHPQNELRLLLQRIAVESLLLEVDHWQTVSEIKMRRAAEQRDLLFLANVDLPARLRQISKCFSTDMNMLSAEKINVTFEKARAMPACRIANPANAREEIELLKEEIAGYLFQTLHSAAALAARGETPMKLAELRLAEEEHRFSIRHSAAMARTYEVTLTSGTSRLARFYAGGLRPEKIAQLIHSAAAITIPTAIAVK